MAKCKVTRKWLNESYPCISVSYCGLDSLLTFEGANYYTCGVYGWNCDAYALSVDGHNVCITTGYRGLIHNFDNNNSYDLYMSYNKRAQYILHDHNLKWDSQKIMVNNLLKGYLRAVIAK